MSEPLFSVHLRYPPDPDDDVPETFGIDPWPVYAVQWLDGQHPRLLVDMREDGLQIVDAVGQRVCGFDLADSEDCAICDPVGTGGADHARSVPPL